MSPEPYTAEAEIEIAAPPEAVWEWLVEPRLIARLSEALDTLLDPATLPERSQLRAGYRYVTGTRARRSFFSRGTDEAEMATEITAFEPPRHYGTDQQHPYMRTADEHTLEATEEGTRVRIERTTSYRGLAAKGIALAASVRHPGMEELDRIFDQTLVDYLDKLKALVEAGE